MTGTYVHLSGADLDDDLLKAAGVEIKESKKPSILKPIRCSRCGMQNPGEARYCLQCGLPVNPEEVIGAEIELEQELQSLKAYTQQLLDRVEKLEERKG